MKKLRLKPEKAMTSHSSTLAWKILWTEGPGRLQSMGSLRVGHDWVASLSLFTFMHWRKKWQPTPVFLPGESQGRRSLVGCHLWGPQSRRRLTWLSSSSRRPFHTAPASVGYPKIQVLWLPDLRLLHIWMCVWDLKCYPSCLKKVPHHLVLQGLGHELLRLLTFNKPWKGVRGRD